MSTDSVAAVRGVEDDVKAGRLAREDGVQQLVAVIERGDVPEKVVVAALYALRRVAGEESSGSVVQAVVAAVGCGRGDVARAAVAVGVMVGATTETLAAVVRSDSAELVEVLVGRFLRRFADLRLAVFEAVVGMCAAGTLDGEQSGRVVDVLSGVGGGAEMGTGRLAEELAAGQTGKRGRAAAGDSTLEEDKALAKAGRRAYADAWLAVLALDLPEEVLVRAVEILPRQVLPQVAQPLRFADFFTRAYDCGSLTSVLALDGLFHLIAHHNLDYPLFFAKLYNIISPRIFFHPRRAPFLTLIPKFLASSNLPEYLVAAFLKRLLRTAVHAPPYGALWSLRLALDLMRRHPATHTLVHRGDTSAVRGSLNFFDRGSTALRPERKADADADADAGADGSGPADPYNEKEVDPAKSGATESSLWELEALRRHYCPAVARLVEAFGQDIRRQGTVKPPAPPPGDVADYVDMGYSEVYEAEFRRRFTSAPLAYDRPGVAGGEGAGEQGIVQWQ